MEGRQRDELKPKSGLEGKLSCVVWAARKAQYLMVDWVTSLLVKERMGDKLSY